MITKEEVIEMLAKFSNEERTLSMRKSCPTSLNIYGVSVPHIKQVAKEIVGITKLNKIDERKHLAFELSKSDIFECQCAGFEYIKLQKDILNNVSKNDLEYLGSHLDNWVSVDTFSVYINGFLWNKGVITIDEIKKRLESPDVWQRRIAVVSTVPLNQKSNGGKGDTKQTLEICEMVIADKHPLITKALSWALRELSKRDKESVMMFYRANENKLSPHVKREVLNKIITGKKN